MSLVDPVKTEANAKAINRWLVLAVALAARLAYLALKPAIVFSDDVRGWKTVAAFFAAGRNPYDTGLLNWPPVWPGVIWVLDHLSHWSGIGFVPLIWTLLIAIELALIEVTFDILLHFGSARQARNATLIGLALNPVAILQTTQHGNFDVLVALFIVLGVRQLIRFEDVGHSPRAWLWATAWLGMGAATKTVPLTLLPLLATGATRLRWPTRIGGACLLLAPVAAGMTLIYRLDPLAVQVHVLNYRSFGEFYGFSGIANLWHWDWMLPVLAWSFTCTFPLAIMTLAAFLFQRKSPLPPRYVVLLAALLLLSIPTLGPGYANQYIYWYLPLMVISWLAWPTPQWRRLLLMAWLVAAATYCFEYAVEPNLGNLLIRLFPNSNTALALCISWSDRRGMILDRLPLFTAQLALLIGGVRMSVSAWREDCFRQRLNPAGAGFRHE